MLIISDINLSVPTVIAPKPTCCINTGLAAGAAGNTFYHKITCLFSITHRKQQWTQVCRLLSYKLYSKVTSRFIAISLSINFF